MLPPSCGSYRYAPWQVVNYVYARITVSCAYATDIWTYVAIAKYYPGTGVGPGEWRWGNHWDSRKVYASSSSSTTYYGCSSNTHYYFVALVEWEAPAPGGSTPGGPVHVEYTPLSFLPC